MSPTKRARCAAFVAMVLTALSTSVAAQVVERETFSVLFPNATNVDIDAVPDGTWVVVCNHFDADTIVARRFTPAGVLVGESTLAGGQPDDEPVVAVDPHGGLVVAWREDVTLVPGFKIPGLFMRRVGPDGAPLGPKTRVSPVGSFVEAPVIATLPSGSILTWSDGGGLQSRGYTTGGTALSGAVTLDATGAQSECYRPPTAAT